ncbi:MAG: hypothetical protein ACP5HS_03525 [Anaerolineae bacterium]
MPDHRMQAPARRRWPPKTVIIVVATVLVILQLCVSGCSAVTPLTPPGEPEDLPTEMPEPSSTPSETPLETLPASPAPVVESSGPVGTTLGQMDLEYPLSMEPGTTDTVILEVYVPPLLASADPSRVARVVTPQSTERASDAFETYVATIYISAAMRAELASSAFEVAEQQPAQQLVEVNAVEQPTYWMWILKAPPEAGKHVFVLKLYLDTQSNPSWTGSFEVQVSGPPATSTPTPTATPTLAPTPVPTTTPTPVPPFQAAIRDVYDNAAVVLGGILALAGAIVAALINAKAADKKPASRHKARGGHGTWPASLIFRLKEWWKSLRE